MRTFLVCRILCATKTRWLISFFVVTVTFIVFVCFFLFQAVNYSGFPTGFNFASLRAIYDLAFRLIFRLEAKKINFLNARTRKDDLEMENCGFTLKSYKENFDVKFIYFIQFFLWGFLNLWLYPIIRPFLRFPKNMYKYYLLAYAFYDIFNEISVRICRGG